MKNHKLQETTESRPSTDIPQEPFPDQLDQMRRIESGGEIKRIDVRTLPQWLKVFYYVMVGLAIVMAVTGIFMSLTK